MKHNQLRAIEAVAETVRRSRSRRGGPSRLAQVRSALRRVSSVTQLHGKHAVNDALEMIEHQLLRPIDPSAIEWNVFRLFETSDSEVDWTKWLAAALRPENGLELSKIVWRSLCDAVWRQGQDPRPIARDGRLATLDTWRVLRDNPPPRGCVDRECHDVEHGRTDIEIDAPEIFVIVENKLDAGWHYRHGDPQPVRYRKRGVARSRGRRLGLVLLTKDPEFELGPYPDWVKITYQSLARALRKNLKEALGATVPTLTILTLWPALLTIAAIEQDLMGLDIEGLRRAARQTPSWRSLEPLNHVIDHLRDEEG